MDSCTKFESYIERAKELEMKAIAFSEHGNVLSWVKKKLTVEKYGLKYIHAFEAYVTESLDEKVRDNYHVVLIAKNWEGVKEINKMSSISFNKEDGHNYYNPRITYEELKNTSDNIIITTACLGGILYSASIEMKLDFVEFLTNNKHRVFLEIQHHNVSDQIEYNKSLYGLHKSTGIPMIAGTDTHSLNSEYAYGRELLQKGKKVHFDSEDSWDLTMKSYDELIDSYKDQESIPMEDVVVALENTNKMADMIEEFEFDYSHKYPQLYDQPDAVFKEKVNAGWIEKKHSEQISDKAKIKEYIDRIKYEFDVMHDNGSINYMLLEENIKSAMREKGIYCGYSRGSVSGSECAELLGVTDIDAIKFDMNFERFMNKERVSLADVDSDWAPHDREKVKEYVYSLPNIYKAEIVTFNTIALRGAIRDVGGALDMELSEVDYIAKHAEDDEQKFRGKHPELFKYVDLLQGTIMSIGNHPAATIVSPYPLDESMGLFASKGTPHPISQLNMKEVDLLNYVKLDILGLDNVGIINDTCRLAGIDRLTPNNMDFEDDKVWENIIKSPVGVFQFEGDYAHKYLSDLLSKYEEIRSKVGEISRVDLMSLANGAIRPAGDSYRKEMAEAVIRDNGNDALNEMMSNTMGYLVYQEQIIEFLNKFCGFTMGEADIIRRGFAKKTGTEEYIPKIKEGFIKTMTCEYGMEKSKAEHDIEAFLQVIEDASRYLFSRNHSDPYTFIGYATAYLRTYYPYEFISTLLTYNESKLDKTAKIIDYAKTVAKIGIESAKFRYSSADYTFDESTETIYKGVASIKDLSSNVGVELYDLRDRKYKDFLELLPDILETSINKTQLEILIKLGYFSEFGKSKKLLKINEIYGSFSNAKVINKGKFDEKIEGIISKYSRATEKQFRDIDNRSIISDLICNLKDVDMPIEELCAVQMKYLGYLNIQLDTDKNNCIITNIDTKFAPKLEVMSLRTGKSIVAKIYKNQLGSLQVGDLIKIGKIFKENGWIRTEDGEFERSPDPAKKNWRIKTFVRIAEWDL